ncbi:MAG: hypothetical protein R2762_27805 [Bryobacteraceae bacterium]
MPTIVGYHNITKERITGSPPEAQRDLRSAWRTNIRTFVDPQNPNRVAVMMDVPDMDALMATMQTAAAADAMDHDGVVPESLVFLVEA